jgi:hypothetical protein
MTCFKATVHGIVETVVLNCSSLLAYMYSQIVGIAITPGKIIKQNALRYQQYNAFGRARKGKLLSKR